MGVCRVHFLRNVLARVPKGSAEMVAAAIRTVFAQPDAAAVADQLDSIAAKLGRQFPVVEAMLCDAAPDICAFAAFPTAHWKKTWSTNPLERVNKEIKRRTNVVGIFPNAAGVLRLGPSTVTRFGEAPTSVVDAHPPVIPAWLRRAHYRAHVRCGR